MKARNDTDAALAYIKLLLQKMLGLKYVYLAAFILLFSAAFLYNKYASKVYELSAVIGPVKDSRTSALASNDMFNGQGTSYSGRELESVMNGLNSFTLISKIVGDLNLETGYFAKSNQLLRKYKEIYLQSPFVVNLDKSHIQPIDSKFYVNVLSDSTYRLTSSESNCSLYNYIDNEIITTGQVLHIDTICKFNETISNWNYKFSISPKKELLKDAIIKKGQYLFVFYHPEQLAKYYTKNLKVTPVSYLAAIIKIQFSSENLYKSLNFLNTFVNSYLEDNLDKKNRIARGTIKFIDAQISEMSDSLANSESKLKNFRSANQVMDLGFQGQQIYEQLSQVESEQTNLELQIRYYNYVLNYFRTNQDISGVILPSSSKINDPVINNLFSDLLKLSADKSAISSTNDKNVFSAQIDNKIKVQKQVIMDNVTTNLNTLNLTLNELKYKSEKLSNDLANMPGKELNMVNVKRKFDLNNTLYTYLLQKRSEAAITLSSNYPDYEVLEPAREITSEIIKPKKIMLYAISVFLALFIPTIVILIRDFFNDKISSAYDIGRISDHAIFGSIFNNSKNYEFVVTESPGSAISESFRNLRSALLFKLNSLPSKTILVTSSQPQDGKSFVSINLAASIASVGFKTVIVDCDLRRPVLHTKFKIENGIGMSNYMMKQAGLDDIIHKTSIENLSVIMAGPILPNPSELISSGALEGFFDDLKSKFEFIIVDTAPIGIVSDSIQLIKYVSQVLVVTRNNSTRKEILENAINSLDLNKITNYEIVYNDFNLEKSPYSSYKSYYKK
jgi:tyrosine-protein kinase Etk/Wzc